MLAKKNMVLFKEMGVVFSCRKGNVHQTNQDNFFAVVLEDMKIFGVFDGHGPFGHTVSMFVQCKLADHLLSNPNLKTDTKSALLEAFQQTNEELFKQYVDSVY